MITPLRSNLDTQNSSVIQGDTLAGFIVLSWFQFDYRELSRLCRSWIFLSTICDGLKHVASIKQVSLFGLCCDVMYLDVFGG